MAEILNINIQNSEPKYTWLIITIIKNCKNIFTVKRDFNLLVKCLHWNLTLACQRIRFFNPWILLLLKIYFKNVFLLIPSKSYLIHLLMSLVSIYPNSVKLLLSSSNTLSPSFSLLFMLPWSGELANLRGDKGQMDFGALDYSNDRGKVRQRGVVGAAGYPFTHITIPLRSTRGKSSQTHNCQTSPALNRVKKKRSSCYNCRFDKYEISYI